MRKPEVEEDLVTVDDFFALVPEGQKADLIDGVIYMASPDTLDSDEICGFVKFLMQGYAKVKGLGKVVGSRFAFQLTETRAPEPDVAFISTSTFSLLTKKKMMGAPDIAVEVVSRDSRQRDYFDKKHVYQEAGAGEYWIIDPLQRRAEFYRLRGGVYELVRLKNNRIFQSETLKGLWLDIEWLFADPLPSEYEKLKEILGAN